MKKKFFLKRALSFLLCAAMMLGAAVISFPDEINAASRDVEFLFDSPSSLDRFSNPNSVTYSFSKGEGALQVFATGGGDPYIMFGVGDKVFSADTYKYVVVTYKTPATNSSTASTTELFMCAGDTAAPTAGRSVKFAPEKGWKYRSQIIDMTGVSYWNGIVHGIRFDVFAAASAYDAFYLSSVVFCDSAAAASAAAAVQSARANGDVSDIPETVFASRSYDLATYTEKYWRGNVVYNESVYPLENPDGSISPVSLMYDIKSVISVRDSALGTEYKYGVDYTVNDGKLCIIKGANIKTVPYSSYKTSAAPADATFWQPTRDGGYTYFSENGSYHAAQLSVTYTHEDPWNGPVPESRVANLSRTAAKLQNKERLVVVFNGDSITVGCNASSFKSVNKAPYMPIWSDMTVAAMKAEFGYSDIPYANTAVGGMTSAWGAENAYTNAARYVPDLVIIGFGMNDGTMGMEPEEYISNIKSIMASVRAMSPECEFILIATPLANPDTYFAGRQGEYLPYLKALEGDGVAVLDMTSLHSYLLGIKKYSDMTGNNVNHPNDFLIRLYTQAIMTLLTPSDLDRAKADAVRTLGSFVDPADYRDAEKAEIAKIIEEYSAKINAAGTEEEVRALLKEATDKLAALKTAAEYDNADLDYTRLVFDREKTFSTVTATNSATIVRDSAEGAARITCTGADPWIRVSYSGKALSADTYKYVVVVYKVPAAVTTSSVTELFFTAGSMAGESAGASRSFVASKNKYEYQIIDLSAASYWTGRIKSIRLDPFGVCNPGDVMFLHSLCLFEGAAEAAEYGQKTAAVLNGEYLGVNEYTLFDTQERCGRITSDEEPFVLGDVDENGTVNAADLASMKLYLAGQSASVFESAADMDRDRAVTVKDELLLKKTAAGEAESETLVNGAKVSYSTDMSSAALTVYSGGKAQIKIDLSDKDISAQTIKNAVITYLAPTGNTANIKADVSVMAGGVIRSAASFTAVPSSAFNGAVLDLSSIGTLDGKIDEIIIDLDAEAGDRLYVGSLVLSDSEAAARRAAGAMASSANRRAGFGPPPVTGQEIIPWGDSDVMVSYAYHNGKNGDSYKYTSGLTVMFDSQPSEKFDRFTLTYTSSTLTRGVISYNVNGSVVQDEFFLEAAASPAKFSSLIMGYMNSERACELISIVLYPISASSSEFALREIKTEDYADYRDTVYLENDRVKLGILLTMGGGISHYEQKDGAAGYTNLLNSHDVGRLIQQSYYGISGPPYEMGDMGGTPWRYNPVQGGDVHNNQSRLVDIVVSDDSIYVKARPMDWGHNNHLTPSYMENNYTLCDNFVKVDNRFVDFSTYTHTAASQELPAFYTVSALSNFCMYNGSSPWTGDAYSVYSNLGFWAGSDQYYALKNTSEYWYAWTDNSGFGVGLYVPNVSTILAGRFGTALSKDPMANETNYFAPLRTMTLKVGKPLEYSYLICAGNISEIRNTFKNNRAMVNNAGLLAY